MTVPLDASISLTVPPPFATQTWVPSEDTPKGKLPTGIVRMTVPLDASISLTVCAAEGFPIKSEQTAWTLFATALGVGLAWAHARIEYTAKFSGGGSFTYGQPEVGLFSAACGQIFNFLVGEYTVRRCENEPCKRAFVNQLGTAEHGQYRSAGDLRFCTPECAHAERQRRYRRRKATVNRKARKR